MKNRMLDYDLISQKPSLFFHNHKRYTTFFGFICSIICFLLVLSNAIICIVFYIRGDELRVIVSKETKHFSPFVNLSNKIFFYSLVNQTGGTEIDPRVLEVVPTLWMVNYEKSEVEYLKQSRCSNEQYKDEKYKNVFDFDVTEYTCLYRENGEDISLGMTHNPFMNMYLNIYIAKCKNRTENNNHCYSENEIDSHLENMNIFLMLYGETIEIDHHNNKKPLSSNYIGEQVPISNDFKYVHYYEMRQILYETEEGMLFSHLHKESEITFDTSTKTQLIYGKDKVVFYPNTLSTLQFSVNPEYADKYQRSYQSIQTLIANIGGVSNLVMLIMRYFARIVTEGYIYFALTDGMISVNKGVPSTHRVIKITANNFSSSFKTQNDSFNNSGILFNKSNTIKTKKKYITNKPISRKLRISYLDSVIYRIFTKTKKGQFLQFCINFVKKSLNIETIMKLTFNATTLINLTSPDINQKHKLLALDYNSFSVKERSIIKNLQT